MTREGFDAATWKAKREELIGILRADTTQGISRWLDTFAESAIARDVAACNFLVNNSFPLPNDITAVVEKYLRPGVVAWAGGRNAEAARLLSADVPLVEFITARVTAESPEREDEDGEQAAAYALKGAWLEATGRAGEAAAATFEAGSRYGWQGEAKLKVAIDLLTRAIELDPSSVLAYWHLAEAWRVRSFAPEPPYAQRDPLERSLAVWNAGAARQLPDASTSWPYLTRALICEQQARLDDDNRIALWWQAICYLERAILLDPTDSGRWAALGRLHRLLENNSCALYVTAEAVKRDPKEPSALEERAAILADTGRFDEAAQVLEQRLELDGENAWARGVKAYILANRKDYRAALNLIDQVIALEPNSIWNLDLRALCCWMLGERAQARASYERIWAIQSTTSNLASEDRRACAYAAYQLGKVDEAIAVLEKLSGDLRARGDVRRTLGLCQFVKGNVVRAEELLLSGVACAQIHELDAFLAMELADLEARSRDWRRIPRAVTAFNRVKKTTVALVAGLSRSAAEDLRMLAAAEFTTVLQVLPEDDASAMKLGAEAGLARLKLDQQQWKDAAEAYRELHKRRGQSMPEAAVGIERSLEGLHAEARGKAAASDFAAATASFRQLLELQPALSTGNQLSLVHEELGDTLWQAGDSAALDHFQQALALAPAGEDATRLGRLHARVALALQQQGDMAAARTNYLEALQRQREAKSTEAGEALSNACRPLIHNVEHFWAVDALWGTLGADPSIPDLHRDFDIARSGALAYLDDLFGLSKHADASLAVAFVPPISLEVGSGLIPLVDPKYDSGKFIFEDIPAMRNGIESSTGVRMPGINVRGDANSSDRYAILLDEVPVASGAVRVGSKYSLASASDLTAAGILGNDAIESPDPVSGHSGHWCSPGHADALIKRGVPVLTETQFVLAHVDLVLRQHLDAFFGVQELQSLLIELRKKGSVAPELASALANETFCVFFARILRALVREQVPITEWRQVFETAQQLRTRSVEEAVSQIRLTMRDKLAGNQGNVEYLEVPAAWLDLIRSDRGVFDISSVNAHGLLVETRRLLEKRTGPVALVVAPGARFRSFVRRLTEFEFPAVAVLSRDELLRQEGLDSADDPAHLESTSL
jgi:tetratricopeptide (TPR) repeat protein